MKQACTAFREIIKKSLGNYYNSNVKCIMDNMLIKFSIGVFDASLDIHWPFPKDLGAINQEHRKKCCHAIKIWDSGTTGVAEHQMTMD